MPDGNCLFRSLADQLFNDQEKHFSVRSMLVWMESLNRSIFSKYLLSLNEPDIEHHIKKMGRPNAWGTHVEVIAASTFFQIPVYFTSQRPTGEYQWEVIHPIPADKIMWPRVIDCFPEDNNQLSHFELAYTQGTHYDSIVSVESGKPCERCPEIISRVVGTVDLTLD